MLNNLISLIKKYQYVLSYLFFGVLTTIVNYVVYLLCYNMLELPSALSNSVAWLAAVILAFLTNKPFVFRSHDWSAKTVIPELVSFLGCRIGSGLAETGILLITVDILSWNGNIWKILTSILVVVLNYFASKLIVFKK